MVGDLRHEHDLVRAERPSIGDLEPEDFRVERDHLLDVVHVHNGVSDFEVQRRGCAHRGSIALPQQASVLGTVHGVTTAHLIALSEKAYDRLRARLEDLTDDEYLWEPAPLAWSVRETPEGLRFDFGLVPVAPVPITTIAWRLTHIIDLLREDRCPRVLGVPPAADVDEIWITTSAPEAVSLLERSFATWRGYLAATDPGQLLEPSDGLA